MNEMRRIIRQTNSERGRAMKNVIRRRGRLIRHKDRENVKSNQAN